MKDVGLQGEMPTWNPDLEEVKCYSISRIATLHATPNRVEAPNTSALCYKHMIPLGSEEQLRCNSKLTPTRKQRLAMMVHDLEKAKCL